MGFLDKAKKLAEQAQTKLDEVQSQINTQGAPKPPSGPIVEYDKHGRPIPPQQNAAPPHGDPLAGAAGPGAPYGSAPPTGPMTSAPPSPHGDPLAGATPPPPPAPPASAGPAPGSSPPWPPPGEASGPPPMPGVPPTEPPSGPPAPVEGTVAPPPAPGMPGASDEDRNRQSYAPPKLTGGDPLAG